VALSNDMAARTYGDHAWFQQIIDGSPLAIQVTPGRTNGQPMLTVATPIRNTGGEMVGVVMFTSQMEDIVQQMQIHRLGETGVAYMVDSQNMLMAHPRDIFSAQLHDLSHYPSVVALRNGDRGVLDFTDAGGIQWKAVVVPLDNEWGLIVQQQVSEWQGPCKTSSKYHGWRSV